MANEKKKMPEMPVEKKAATKVFTVKPRETFQHWDAISSLEVVHLRVQVA